MVKNKVLITVVYTRDKSFFTFFSLIFFYVLIKSLHHDISKRSNLVRLRSPTIKYTIVHMLGSVRVHDRNMEKLESTLRLHFGPQTLSTRHAFFFMGSKSKALSGPFLKCNAFYFGIKFIYCFHILSFHYISIT